MDRTRDLSLTCDERSYGEPSLRSVAQVPVITSISGPLAPCRAPPPTRIMCRSGESPAGNRERMQIVDRIVAPLRRPGTAGRAGFANAAPALATVILVVVIAAQLAALLWRGLGAGEEAPAPPAPFDTGAGPAIDLPAIVNAHLFGIAKNSGDPSDAPVTSANLTLAGTLAGTDPATGWAIIGASGQSARVYATGASLPGGAKLAAVYPDRVILDRGGARESLVLPRLSGTGGAVNYAPPVSQGAMTPDDMVQQVLGQDPNELLRPQPVYAGTQLRGFRVYPGRNRTLFARIGLEPGDLVTAINGAPIEDAQRGIEALRGLSQGAAVTLTIERNGQPRQLTVDAAQAAQQLQQLPETEQTAQPEASQ
jgi:general secretion pathway protein C